MYFISINNFQDHESTQRMYLRLRSEANNTYIVPPAEYGNILTKHAVISGFKVNHGCVPVPASSFPLWVDVCEANSCQKARRTGHIDRPGHYTISGIGGMMSFQLEPQSPCSEQFVNQIQNVDEYVDVSQLVP